MIIVFYIYIYVSGVFSFCLFVITVYIYILAVGQNPDTLLFSKIAGIHKCSFPGHFIGFDQSPFIIALYQ
jgi:hypothetical protein